MGNVVRARCPAERAAKARNQLGCKQQQYWIVRTWLVIRRIGCELPSGLTGCTTETGHNRVRACSVGTGNGLFLAAVVDDKAED
jgi:hypothetical protein